MKNLIVLLGDGMGAAQRTAARIVKGGYVQGKALGVVTTADSPMPRRSATRSSPL